MRLNRVCVSGCAVRLVCSKVKLALNLLWLTRFPSGLTVDNVSSLLPHRIAPLATSSLCVLFLAACRQTLLQLRWSTTWSWVSVDLSTLKGRIFILFTGEELLWFQKEPHSLVKVGPEGYLIYQGGVSETLACQIYPHHLCKRPVAPDCTSIQHLKHWLYRQQSSCAVGNTTAF